MKMSYVIYFLCVVIVILVIYLALTPDMETDAINKIRSKIKFINGKCDIINNIKSKIKFKNGKRIIIAIFILTFAFQYVLFFNPNVNCLFGITTVICIFLFNLFAKFNKLSRNTKVNFVIIGGIFIATCMTGTSMPLNQENTSKEEMIQIYQLKVFWNFIYLAVPSFFIYELSKENKLLNLLSRYRKQRKIKILIQTKEKNK